ncbi:MAG: nucleotide exchange factor GrpE [Elusimicrobia bacterium]|nr:nucleotide exchange factor GrpE [Elusimicrobiota bacterium]
MGSETKPTQAPAQADSGKQPQAAAEPNYYDQLLRLKAEFENYRKRVDREKPELYQLGKAELLLRFLPIYDLLQKAHEQIQKLQADTAFAQGMEGIFKEFDKIFKEEGVSTMSPAGKPYDALRHEVVGAVERTDLEEGCVVDVLQGGFMLKDKVLRPARVRISKRPISQEKQSEGEENEQDHRN